MIIKKFVVGSMFSMLLGSEMAAADWGDVYYCQMTNLLEISIEGKQTNYKLEKFQFKLDQTKNAMVFGSTGMFKNEVIELTKGTSFPRQEILRANTLDSKTYFRVGKFLYTSIHGKAGITSVSADCDKF